ncbi:hypothetical protein L484_005767 [Morus notabilis]|uniref:Uncharacterized protein n=1 Tax=Morus notabilis TaxID=981085 RepID=W9SBH7_9ROSA|nr:hypothetical protein L484_005767 [Morus notabilis]
MKLRLPSILLAVQLTKLVDRIFIACTMNHTPGTANLSGNFQTGISRPQYLIFGYDYLDGVVDLPIHIPLRRDEILGRPNMPSLQQRMLRFCKNRGAQGESQCLDEHRRDIGSASPLAWLIFRYPLREADISKRVKKLGTQCCGT